MQRQSSEDSDSEKCESCSKLPEKLTPDFVHHLSNLSEEIYKLVDSLSPTEKIKALRNKVLNKIRHAVHTAISKTARIEVFGSVAHGLSTIHSDLDLGVHCKLNSMGPHPPDRHEGNNSNKTTVNSVANHYEQSNILRKLSKTLRKPRYQGVVKNVFRARVPIIKFTCKETNLECDIKIGDNLHELKTAYMKACVQSEPRIRPFIFAIKRWAKCRNIGDASQGSLNILGHTSLALQFLQTLDTPILPEIPCEEKRRDWIKKKNPFKGFGTKNKLKLGELLLRFFEYYANFPFKSLGVCVRHATPKPKEFFDLYEGQKDNMIIQDIFDERDNVARNVSKKMRRHIKSEFIRAFTEMMKKSEYKEIACKVQQQTSFAKNSEIRKYLKAETKLKKKIDLHAVAELFGVSHGRVKRIAKRSIDRYLKIQLENLDNSREKKEEGKSRKPTRKEDEKIDQIIHPILQRSSKTPKSHYEAYENEALTDENDSRAPSKNKKICTWIENKLTHSHNPSVSDIQKHFQIPKHRAERLYNRVLQSLQKENELLRSGQSSQSRPVNMSRNEQIRLWISGEITYGRPCTIEALMAAWNLSHSRALYLLKKTKSHGRKQDPLDQPLAHNLQKARTAPQHQHNIRGKTPGTSTQEAPSFNKQPIQAFNSKNQPKPLGAKPCTDWIPVLEVQVVTPLRLLSSNA